MDMIPQASTVITPSKQNASANTPFAEIKWLGGNKTKQKKHVDTDDISKRIHQNLTWM